MSVEVRIRPGLVSMDAFVLNEDTTVTKNWTTVTQSEAQAALQYRFKGELCVELRGEIEEIEPEEIEIDEIPVTEIDTDDAEDVDTEDESDGTE